MKDLVISACRWIVNAEAPPYKKRALDHYRACYTVLLSFLREEGLLADPSLGEDVTDWLEFELRQSQLTEEGFELVRRCIGTWNPSYGQGHTQRHMVQWRRKLSVMRRRG